MGEFFVGFNRRKIEGDRKAKADKEAAARHATDAQVLEDAERLIADWNERQVRQTLMFAPRSRLDIGSCGYVAPRAEQLMRLTCGPWIVTRTPR